MINQAGSSDIEAAETEQQPRVVLSEDIRTKLEHQLAYVQRIMRRLGVAHEIKLPKQDDVLLNDCRLQMDELDEAVSLLKRGLNRWCLSVLGWEFLILVLLSMAVVGGGFLAGYWSVESPLQPWKNFLMERPIFVALSLIIFVVLWVVIHAMLRQRQAKSVVEYLQRLIGDERLVAAFLKNTTFWHSIFHPEPVGWSWPKRRRVKRLKQYLEEVGQQYLTSEKVL